MKKLLAFLSVLVLLVLAACGGGNAEGDGKITVGATSVPHAEILEEAKPLLEEQGITLDIQEYQDYVLPNDALADGDLDANYFQHIPFLQQTINDTGYDLDHIGGIHIEPMGVYSQNIESVDAIPEGTEVLMSNSVPDHGRILSLFEREGLITLDENVEKSAATIDDIVENPKNLTFTPDYDPALLPNLHQSEEDVLTVINTNYAIGAGLDPQQDALFIEEDDSEYVNVIAVKSEDTDNPALNTLVDVLRSEEIQNFIIEKYDGAVVPVDGEE